MALATTTRAVSLQRSLQASLRRYRKKELVDIVVQGSVAYKRKGPKADLVTALAFAAEEAWRREQGLKTKAMRDSGAVESCVDDPSQVDDGTALCEDVPSGGAIIGHDSRAYPMPMSGKGNGPSYAELVGASGSGHKPV